MKITRVEFLTNKEPIHLAEPWRPAWREPDGGYTINFNLSLYKVYTDQGIIGYGPNLGGDPELLRGLNPFHIGQFWHNHMGGRRAGNSGKRAAGLEIALWDIIGKAAQQPVFQLLGAGRQKIPVYAATSRLLEISQHIEQVKSLIDLGFKAIKLRLHRPDPWSDVEVVEAVRNEVGDTIELLVDANQNNFSEVYKFWSRRTAQQVARELDLLNVYFLEEPLPRNDVEGLAEISASVDMFIAGGEHAPTVDDFKSHLLMGSYDILQPDITLAGNFGIIGLRKVSNVADFFGKLVIPHVTGNGNFFIMLAATLQAMATVDNCPMVEFPYDPPILIPETMQTLLAEPIWIDTDGAIEVPSQPGIGIEIDEGQLALEVSLAWEI